MAWPNSARATGYVVTAADWNAIAAALALWGGNVDGGGYSLSNVASVSASGTITAGTFSGSGASLTGLPISTGVSGLGTGVATFLATPSSANLIAAVTNETGTGSLVFGTSPTLTSPILVTPSAAQLRGGSTAASNLTLRSTSAAGTTDAIIFQTGSQSERMRILTTGEVGIGTASPGTALSVTGTITASTSLVVNSITIGRGTGADSNSTSVGNGALLNNTTGTQNTAVGKSALLSNTTGYNNNAFGYTSLYSNTTGVDNTAHGAPSLYANVNGSFNSALGVYTLYKNISGNHNTAAGHDALFNNLIGGTNTAVGRQSLHLNTIGSNNTAVGSGSLYDLGEVTTAGSFLIGSAYIIETIGDTNFTLIGAASNTVGLLFTASGGGVGTGTASAKYPYFANNRSTVADAVTFTPTSITNVGVEPNTGTVLYVENRTPLSRFVEQIEDIRVIIQF